MLHQGLKSGMRCECKSMLLFVSHYFFKKGEWNSVSSGPPGALVVNIGDLMARWSNNTLRSTVHKARNPPRGGPGRLSMARFCCCNFDTMVESLIPPEEQAPIFPPVSAGLHMLERIGEANPS